MKKGQANWSVTVSQSLPNQVNDFNMKKLIAKCLRGEMSQSLPNQVNDFNRFGSCGDYSCTRCRNPFQTRSTTSINRIINLFMRRESCRNPFQTRSTTSIIHDKERTAATETVAIPSKPGQRLQSYPPTRPGSGAPCVAIPSKPGQRLQFPTRSVRQNGRVVGRNPFQTRSTTSIIPWADQPDK